MRSIVRLAAVALAAVMAVLVGATPVAAGPVTAALPTCGDWTRFRTPSDQIITVPTTTHNSGNWSCKLQVGNRNAAVFVLQDAINRCNGGRLKVDAIYGARTRDAVLWLQAVAGIDTDGVYGPVTAMLAIRWPDQVFAGACIPLIRGTPV